MLSNAFNKLWMFVLFTYLYMQTCVLMALNEIGDSHDFTR